MNRKSDNQETVDFAIVLEPSGQQLWSNRILSYNLGILSEGDDIYGIKLNCSQEEALYLIEFLNNFCKVKENHNSNGVSDFNISVRLLKIATSFGCLKLYKKVLIHLWNNLSLENCGSTWKEALELGEAFLAQHVEEYLKKYYDTIKFSKKWKNLPADLKSKICTKKTKNQLDNEKTKTWSIETPQRNHRFHSSYNQRKTFEGQSSVWNRKICKKRSRNGKLMTTVSCIKNMSGAFDAKLFWKLHYKYQNTITFLTLSSVSNLSPTGFIPFDQNNVYETTMKPLSEQESNKGKNGSFSEENSSLEISEQLTSIIENPKQEKEELNILPSTTAENYFFTQNLEGDVINNLQEEYFFYPFINWKQNSNQRAASSPQEVENVIQAFEIEEEEPILFENNDKEQENNDISMKEMVNDPSLLDSFSSVEDCLDTLVESRIQGTGIQINNFDENLPEWNEHLSLF